MANSPLQSLLSGAPMPDAPVMTEKNMLFEQDMFNKKMLDWVRRLMQQVTGPNIINELIVQQQIILILNQLLTTKGDLLTFDTTTVRLPVGTNGQLLTADSTVAKGIKWAVPAFSSPLTTKGDLLGFSTLAARVPVGTNGHILTADSTDAEGVIWAAPAAAAQDVDVLVASAPAADQITTIDNNFDRAGANFATTIPVAAGAMNVIGKTLVARFYVHFYAVTGTYSFNHALQRVSGANWVRMITPSISPTSGGYNDIVAIIMEFVGVCTAIGTTGVIRWTSKMEISRRMNGDTNATPIDPSTAGFIPIVMSGPVDRTIDLTAAQTYSLGTAISGDNVVSDEQLDQLTAFILTV